MVGDLYGGLEAPERLALDAQSLGMLFGATGPHEQGHRMSGPRQRTTHQSAHPARSENRVSHLLPPSILCSPPFVRPAYAALHGSARPHKRRYRPRVSLSALRMIGIEASTSRTRRSRGGMSGTSS